MRTLMAVIFLAGCGGVSDTAVDAAAIDAPATDAPAIDAPAIDAPAIDAAIDAPDLRPHLVFVTSTTYSGAMGGLVGADAACQQRAAVAGLAGMYKAWLADATSSPATRMTHHLGPYQLTTGVIVAQGWTDLTDGNLANKVDRDENQVMSQGTFICRGGEVWSNVDGAGNLRTGTTGDCTSWTTTGGVGVAGNVTSQDVMWTASGCFSIGCVSTLPIYCVQQ